MTLHSLIRYLPWALAGSLLLTGCSNAPSAGDAQNALEAAFGNCKQVDFVDFEKVNGIANGDSHYSLQVKYGLKFAVIEENAKAAQQLQAFLEAQKTKAQQAQVIVDAARAKNDALEAKSGGVASSDVVHEKIFDDKFYAALDITKNDHAVQFQANREAREQMANTLLAACPNLPREVALEYAKADLASFGESIRLDYHNDNLPLLKSDNGWIVDQQ